jgi:hypothetical protein
MARTKKSNYNFKNIILILLFVVFIFLLLFIYVRNTKSENFVSSNLSGDGLPFPGGSAILSDCNSGYSRMANNVDCNKSAWVTNSKLLCGICDGTNANEVSNFTMIDPNTNKPVTLYGCANKNALNAAAIPSVQWNRPTDPSIKVRKLNSYLTDRLTCNFYSKNKSSDLCLMVGCSDSCKITINGVNLTQTIPTYGYYYIPNVLSDANIVITSTTSRSNVFGGIGLSYIWNKQLYILDQNGFENCTNIINYTVDNNIGFSKIWYNQKGLVQLPLWMQNWIQSTTGSISQNQKMTLSFKVGDINPNSNGLINNDLVLLLGVNSSADVLLNNIIQTTVNGPTTKSIVIPDVVDGDVLKINGKGGKGMHFMYLWSGFIYMLDGGINSMFNFNSLSTTTPLDFNIINPIEYTKTNLGDFTYPASSYIDNPFFVRNWLKANNNNFSMSVTLQSGTQSYGLVQEEVKQVQLLSTIQNKKILPLEKSSSAASGQVVALSAPSASGQAAAPSASGKSLYSKQKKNYYKFPINPLISSSVPVVKQYSSNKNDYASVSIDCESECNNTENCNFYALSYGSTSKNCKLLTIPQANNNDISSPDKFGNYFMSPFDMSPDNYKKYYPFDKNGPPYPIIYGTNKNYKQNNNINYIKSNNKIIPEITNQAFAPNPNYCKIACSMIESCKGFTTNKTGLESQMSTDFQNGQRIPGYSCNLLSSISDGGIVDNKMDTYIIE